MMMARSREENSRFRTFFLLGDSERQRKRERARERERQAHPVAVTVVVVVVVTWRGLFFSQTREKGKKKKLSSILVHSQSVGTAVLWSVVSQVGTTAPHHENASFP